MGRFAIPESDGLRKDIEQAKGRAQTDWERMFLHDVACVVREGQRVTHRQRLQVRKILTRPEPASVEPTIQAESAVWLHLTECLQRIRFVSQDGEAKLIEAVEKFRTRADDLDVVEIGIYADKIEREHRRAIDRCRPMPFLSPWKV